MILGSVLLTKMEGGMLELAISIQPNINHDCLNVTEICQTQKRKDDEMPELVKEPPAVEILEMSKKKRKLHA